MSQKLNLNENIKLELFYNGGGLLLDAIFFDTRVRGFSTSDFSFFVEWLTKSVLNSHSAICFCLLFSFFSFDDNPATCNNDT